MNLDKISESIVALIDIGNFDLAMQEAHNMLDKYECGEWNIELRNVFENTERFFLNVPNAIHYITYMRRLADLYAKENNYKAQVDTLYLLTMDYISANECDLAYITCSQGMALVRKHNYHVGEAKLHNGFGSIYKNSDDFHKALECYHKAYVLSDAIDYKEGVRFAHNIGIIYRKLGNLEDAKKYLNIAYEYNRNVKKGIFANTCNEYGHVLIELGEYELAKAILDEGKLLCIETKSNYFLKENYSSQALLYEKLGEFALALEYYKKVYELDRTINKIKLENQLRLLSFQSDLSNKEAEHKKIEQKNKSLEALSGELALKNKEMSLLLSQVDAYKESLWNEKKQTSYSRMLGGVSHQINTAIGNSMLLASYMKTETQKVEVQFLNSTLTKKKLSEYISANDRSLAIMLESQNGITNFMERVRAMPVSLLEQKRSSSLEKIINSSIEKYQEAISRIGVDLKLSLIDPLPRIKGAQVLAYIIEELMTNTFKYAFINQKNPRISISVNKTSDQGLVICYKDNGVGISSQTVEHIFDPFYTSDMGTKGGNGLGLYFVSKMVYEVLNGTITCESNEDKGCFFELILPNDGIDYA